MQKKDTENVSGKGSLTGEMLEAEDVLAGSEPWDPVETKLIVYKGFGHGISKPKERLAAIWHNWQWFAKHIWDEDTKIPLKQ